MKNLSSFLENPFYVLGASPSDSRPKIISLADEAVLLSDCNVEDALNQLTNHQRRLEAEINWFPTTNPERVKAMLHYAEEETAASFPEIKTNSALALFNACRVLLETWPIKNTDSAFAMCHSLAILDAAIQPEHVFEEINRDRESAGFQLLNDMDDVNYRLNDFRRSVASKLIERFTACNAVDSQLLSNKLALLYNELKSQMIELIVSDYELRNNDKIEKLHKELKTLATRLSENMLHFQRQTCVSDLLTCLEKWNSLTLPGRAIKHIKGIVGSQTKLLYHDIREAAVHLQNEYQMTEQSISIIHALQSTFVEIVEAQEQLKQDAGLLDKLIQQKAQQVRREYR